MIAGNQKVSQIRSDSFKIRNPNIEIRNNFQIFEIQMTKMVIAFRKEIVLNIGKFETGDPPAGWGVRRTNFEFVSCFVLVISDFITSTK